MTRSQSNLSTTILLQASSHEAQVVDSIHVDSGTFSAGGTKLYGGAGNDTITISGGGTYSVINTNEDNDLINAVGSATISAISFSTGSDTLVLSGTVGTVGMGNGHDEFSGTVVSVTSASTIKLGDGRDTIELLHFLGQVVHPLSPSKVIPIPISVLTRSTSALPTSLVLSLKVRAVVTPLLFQVPAFPA